jgi:hypothetical protein
VTKTQRLSSLFVTAVLLLATSAAQQLPCSTVQLARRLVAVLYPQSVQGNNRIIVTGEGRANSEQSDFPRVTVKLVPPERSLDEKAALVAMFEFQYKNRAGKLSNVIAAGEVVHSKELREARTFVDANTALTDDEVIAVLRQRGARWLPPNDQELVKQVPLKEISKVLGEELKLDSISFKTRYQITQGTEAELVWQLSLSTANNTHYSMSVEPFDGKILSLSVDPK